MSRLARELAALPDMEAKELRLRWQQMDESVPPNVPAWLLRALLAARLQERRHGGLQALVRRELMSLAEAGGSDPAFPRRQKPSPGARLVREWNGRTIAVEVIDDGFRFESRTWRSLSAIVRHVTGAHWSGPRFFGLAPHG